MLQYNNYVLICLHKKKIVIHIKVGVIYYMRVIIFN